MVGAISFGSNAVPHSGQRADLASEIVAAFQANCHAPRDQLFTQVPDQRFADKVLTANNNGKRIDPCNHPSDPAFTRKPPRSQRRLECRNEQTHGYRRAKEESCKIEAALTAAHMFAPISPNNDASFLISVKKSQFWKQT